MAPELESRRRELGVLEDMCRGVIMIWFAYNIQAAGGRFVVFPAGSAHDKGI